MNPQSNNSSSNESTTVVTLPFPKRHFAEAYQEVAAHHLVYGIKVVYGQDKKNLVVYPHESLSSLLVLQNYKERLPNKLEVLDLRDVIDIVQESDQMKQITLKTAKGQRSHLFEFADVTESNLFYQAIQDIIENALINKNANMRIDGQRQFALDLFIQGDSDLSASLSFDEGYALMKRMQVPLSRSDLFAKFSAFDKNKDASLSKEEFVNIAKSLLEKQEFLSLFNKYVPLFSGQSKDQNIPLMDFDQFVAFVRSEQSEEEVEENKTRLAAYFAEHQNLISYNDFVNLLFNQTNSIFHPKKESLFQASLLVLLQICFDLIFSISSQDMTKPLTSYYINSSHNTYLMANQFTGQSSVQAYINAFRRGCRCVEIDVWDDGSEPIVTHGFTFTSSILFRDVILAISEYGFVWSKFPIILSIENHCNKANQKRMAVILKEVLAKQLFLIPESHHELTNYPSPKQLKRMVIIKSKGSLSKILTEIASTSSPTKKKNIKKWSANDIKEVSSFSLTEQINLNQVYEVETLETLEDSPEFLLRIPTMKMLKSINMTPSQQSSPSKALHLEEDEDDAYISKHPVLEVKDFQRCISMVGANFSVDSLEKSTDHSIFQVYSFSEGKIDSLFSQKERAFIEFNKINFCRVYPKGSRVDSSNYDPITSFNCGAQMISLNFQTCDNPLFLYLSRFQTNGGISSGYILKPSWLQSGDISQIPSDLETVIKTVKITIISGQCLRYEEDESKSLSPLVEISLRGTAFDQKTNPTFRTNSVSNAFHPVFKKESSTVTFKVAAPELAMVAFSVLTKGILSDDLIAQYALDLNCVRSGYRVIPLWNKSLKPIPHAYLMAHIKIN